jgi:hypothetical protein
VSEVRKKAQYYFNQPVFIQDCLQLRCKDLVLLGQPPYVSLAVQVVWLALEFADAGTILLADRCPKALFFASGVKFARLRLPASIVMVVNMHVHGHEHACSWLVQSERLLLSASFD